jgi:UDP-N-acetylglucosamine/UDP-N-acetylgalactosamine diphosphorylase
VAALVLAGGQASRLGSNRPKGILPLGTGLGSRTDSLLFLQASQIAYLQQMVKQRFPNNSPQLPKITWLVMTSKTTDADTRAHLQEVLKETGLSWDQVTISVFKGTFCTNYSIQVLVFTQNEIPAFDMDGKVFLAGPTQLVTSPGKTRGNSFYLLKL